MKIGILGGTFDPIHQGHLALARAAKEQFQLDKILFIPAFIPPHKSSQRDLTAAPYRYRMVETAIRNEPDFEISDVEFNRPDVSYTVDTLRSLKKKYPEGRLYLILGADTLSEVPKWREPDEIRKLAGFLVARREGCASGIPRQEGVRRIQMPVCPLSSSEIREKLRQGKLLGEKILPAGVEDYIRRMNLYRGEAPCLSS